MSSTVLSVAYPLAPVGLRSLGGAEQVLTALEAELPRRGIRSLVAAREGSACAGELFATALPDGPLTPEARRTAQALHQDSIDRALASTSVDLLHMHGIDFPAYRLPPDKPVLATLHLPPSWYPDSIWTLPANYRLQCVSESQRRACPPGAQGRLAVVENGVPPGPREPKGDYALLLSRICPEKNLHAGLDAARLAGVPLVLAGEAFPYPEHTAYMDEQIRPRLGAGARWLGPVHAEEKARLLARARCLLLPTLAPETSSLAAMEALAAGTPVIAFPSGALPEVVEHGRTGFLVETVESMAEALGRLDEIDLEACRRAARKRFPLERMVAGYLGLYREILEGNGVCGVEDRIPRGRVQVRGARSTP